jgi:dTDP-4-dehydrorhamnose 3,5-epimerase-like enzyme
MQCTERFCFRTAYQTRKMGRNMSFVIESRNVEDVVIVVPHAHRDERGFFMETIVRATLKSLASLGPTTLGIESLPRF